MPAGVGVDFTTPGTSRLMDLAAWIAYLAGTSGTLSLSARQDEKTVRIREQAGAYLFGARHGPPGRPLRRAPRTCAQ